MLVPAATYRLQFHKDFRFEDARKLLGYLQRLGVSDVYSSPIFRARRGSTHGYDVVDPTSINPELGGAGGFDALVDEIRSRGMGLLLDIVPNHMAVSLDNPWWYDILENGHRSPHAAYFDIDWTPASGIADNKVVLPILRTAYAEALEGQKLNLFLDEQGFAMGYYDLRLPLELNTTRQILIYRLDTLKAGQAKSAIAEIVSAIEQWWKENSSSTTVARDSVESRESRDVIRRLLWEAYTNNPEVRTFLDESITTFNGRKGEPESFELLDRLLNSQWYRLTFWRTALENINYRRFFNISDLISVRTEQLEVFCSTHRLVFDLLREGNVTGLRIDHIDGLRDPHEYLERIHRACSQDPSDDRTQTHADLYVVIEKILIGEEPLREDLAACGTTGYDYLNVLNGVFVDPDGLSKLEHFYADFTGQSQSFRDVRYEKKKLVVGRKFYSEFRSLEDQFNRIANQDRYGRDVSRRELERALLEVIACLPVYRTYIRSSDFSEEDRQVLDRTFVEVKTRNPALSAAAQRFVKRVLTLNFTPGVTQREKERWLSFVMRWQQLTGPIAAKGVEDTALYVYNCLLSLNEVGGDPGHAAVSPLEFHDYNQNRLEKWRHTLNATSTHDTKRGEDARARLNVLSEMPESWARRVGQWSRWNGKFRTEVDGKVLPDENQEIMLYQTLLGSWPLAENEVPDFKNRVLAYVEKAMREAQTYSNWRRPNEANESAVKSFVTRILSRSRSNHFLADFLDFQREIAFYGAVNGLSQVVLKIISPGVPDFYQGSELWNLAMVDPDNRRPVDFASRTQLLERMTASKAPAGEDATRFLNQWRDGAIKLFVAFRFLNFRRAHRDLFERGSYTGLVASGRRRDFLCAALRHDQARHVLGAVPRLVTNLVHPGQFPIGPEVWKDTVVRLPADAPARWRSILTDETVMTNGTGMSPVLRASAIFQTLPVAVLASE
ncbi:MAG: malto-oligosyltrehalose synthase [Acidobacteriota bacterium]